MIRVAYFVGAYRRFTGSQRSLWLLVRDLDRGAVEPLVILPGEGVCAEKFRELGVRVLVEETAPALQEFGGGLLRASAPRRAWLALSSLTPYTLRLWKLLRREGIDVLHANDARGLLLAGPAARLAGVPAIWHVRGDVAALGATYSRVCAWLASKIITVADGVRGSLPARKLITVYNGIGAPPPPRRALHEDGILVVAVGSLVPFKGAHHLIEAARLTPAIHVVFVGDRPDPAYARLLDEMLSDRVRFAGWDDDPTDWFHAADIVCLPTVEREILAGYDGREVRGTEGFSRTVLEAMACGRAVVATRVAGIPEQIEDGRSGLLVPPSDPLALAAALARLAADADLRARLGAAARRRVAERFSIAGMVAATTAVYREISAS